MQTAVCDFGFQYCSWCEILGGVMLTVVLWSLSWTSFFYHSLRKTEDVVTTGMPVDYVIWKDWHFTASKNLLHLKKYKKILQGRRKSYVGDCVHGKTICISKWKSIFWSKSLSFPDHLVHRVSNLNCSSFVNSKVFPKERAGFVDVFLRGVT